MDSQFPPPLDSPRWSSPETSPGRKRAKGIAMICVGLLFAYASFRVGVEQRQFAARATHTRGKVIRMVSTSSGRNDVWVPVFSFRDASGKQWQVTSNASNNVSPYHEGDEVRVLYLPQDPGGARLDDLTSSYTLTAGFAVIAVVLLGVGRLVCRTRPAY